MIAITTNTIKNILNINQKLYETTIDNISTDSRNVGPSTLFIALKGEKFDGHDFIKDVIENKGVKLVITERQIDNIDIKHQIIVKDSLKAFGKLASYNRSLYKGTVIALTGSSGKTTTKELLKSALSVYDKTYATTGNYNNHIGVPRTLLDIDMDSKYTIVEMGMSGLKEIEYLTQLTSPDIAIVTNVYPMHIEFLKTIENIATAKAEIFKGLNKSGIAIYNKTTSNTEILHAFAQKYTDNILTYSSNDIKTLSLLSLEDDAPHNQSNALCVLKVLEALKLDITKAIPTINSFGALEGRGKKHNLNINGKNITLIDDSYSGQPDAMKLAIKKLKQTKTKGKKIALLGKMAELGDYTLKAHQEIGQLLKEEKIDVVIGVCEETKEMLKMLAPTTKQYYYPSIDGLTEFLINDILEENDIILIKGAHYSSQVFKIAKALIEYR